MEIDIQTIGAFQNIPANSGDLKYILDAVNAKYNKSDWKLFTTVLPQSESRKFSVLLDETGIVVKASPLGREGQKPLRSFEGAELYSDSVHKVGHGFKVDQADVDALREMNLVNMDLAAEIAKKYWNRATAVVGGFHATLNDWIYQAISKQTITIYNQGKSTYTLDLRVSSANKLKVKSSNANWFDADSTKYNIPSDLVRMNERADDDDVMMPKDRVFICSKKLRDKMFKDPTVIAEIKARIPSYSTDYILTNSKIEEGLRVALDLPPIVAVDYKSRIEVDGIPQLDSASFDEDMICLIPMGQIFDLHNSPSSVRDEKSNAVITTTIEGGLIGVLEKFGADPMVAITNMEAIFFPSFKNTKYIVSLNSAAHSATGK